MSNITDQELQKLESAKSEEEWSSICDEIKKAHNGYPSDWWAKVKLSGLGDRVAASFGQSFEPKVRSINL